MLKELPLKVEETKATHILYESPNMWTEQSYLLFDIALSNLYHQASLSFFRNLFAFPQTHYTLIRFVFRCFWKQGQINTQNEWIPDDFEAYMYTAEH